MPTHILIPRKKRKKAFDTRKRGKKNKKRKTKDELLETNMSLDIKFTLSNGVTIPGLGFGTFADEGAKGESYAAVLHALRTGYRHLDCAWFYLNEEEIGQAIHDFLKENTNVKRSDIFVATKVWNHMHEKDEVQWSLDDSLKKLKLEYVDLFLIHWPIACESDEKGLPKIGPDGKVSSWQLLKLFSHHHLKNTNQNQKLESKRKN